MTPLVSCICPTYGRPPDYQHLLEEAIESFVRQDWPVKELIILNDAADQTLFCDIPGVSIINDRIRWTTLGEKYNTAIECSYGEFICPWEDDDISLPWRISRSIEAIGDADYYNPRRQWYLDPRGLHNEHPMGFCHNSSMYRRGAWLQLGGYAKVSGAQDQLLDGELRRQCSVSQAPITARDWAYIYRWGVSPCHLSGVAPHQQFYDRVGQQPLSPGIFELRPHWREDYVAMVQTKPPWDSEKQP